MRRGHKANCKIPEEKIQQIIQLYKEKPIIKVSEITNKLGVSNSVVKRVRREHHLLHLGYKRLIGCNRK